MLKKISCFIMTVSIVITLISAIPVSSAPADIQNAYRPGDYTDIVTSNSMWSVYFRNKNDMVGTSNDINNLDVSNWLAAPAFPAAKDSELELFGSAATSDGIYSANTRLFVNPFIPGGTFMARPHGGDVTVDKNAKNSFAIGWTAPYSGNWVFDVELYNRTVAASAGDTAAFAFAKKGKSSNSVEKLTNNQAVSNVSALTDAMLGERTLTIPVDQGETIFLFIVNASASTNIATNIRYHITDAANPGIIYDASKIAQNMMANSSGSVSPFDFGLASEYNLTVSAAIANLTVAVNKAYPATLYSDSGYVWAGNAGNKETGPVLYLNKTNGKLYIKPGLTASPNKSIPLVSFTAPKDGNYSFNMSAKNIADNPADGGVLQVYKLSNSFNTGTDTAISCGHYDPNNYKIYMNQSDRSVNYNKSFFLNKGDKLILESHAGAAANMLYELDLAVNLMNEELVDKNLKILYNKTYDAQEYKEVINPTDMWSAYFRNRNDDDNLDVSKWLKADTSPVKDSIINIGGRDKGGDWYLDTHFIANPFNLGNTLMVRPYESDIANTEHKNSVAVGWTAPYSGTWIVDVELYNRHLTGVAGQGDPGPVAFSIAKKDSNSNTVVKLMDNQQVSAPTTAGVAVVGTKQISVEVEEGDAIFLFVINTSNNKPNLTTNVRYQVSDSANPDIVYDASKMAQNMLAATNGAISPFDFGLSSASELTVPELSLNTSITSASPATLYSDNDYVWAGADNNRNTDPVFYLNKNTGKLTVKPGAVSGSGKRMPLIAFTAPEDGDYSFSLFAKNKAYAPADDGWFYLYKLTDAFDGTALSGGHNDEANYKINMNQGYLPVNWNKLFALKKGDKLILEACAGNTANKLYEFNMAVGKLDEVAYIYSIGDTQVTTFAQVAAANAGSVLDVNSTLLNKDNSTSGTLILAVYDSQDRLVSIDCPNSKDMIGKAYESFAASVSIPGNIAGGMVKAFIWNGTDNLHPLTTADILP